MICTGSEQKVKELGAQGSTLLVYQYTLSPLKIDFFTTT